MSRAWLTAGFHVKLELGVVAIALLAAACGSEPEDPFIKSEERSTRAIISVERSLSLDDVASDGSTPLDGSVPEDGTASEGDTAPIADEATRGNAHAMAHFVSLPQYNDAQLVLDWVGLHRAWPLVDRCNSAPEARPDELDLQNLGNLELLDAGEVSLETERTIARLAPRAFPTVSQIVSGVTYTTRDQSIAPLPAALPYRVRTQGSALLPPLDLVANAPESLSHVTVSGLPLEELRELPLGRPVDVTWLPSQQPATSDLVVIELRGEQTEHAIECAFRDDGGVGTVPAELTRELSGRGQLVVHRIRRVQGQFTSTSGVPGSTQIDFDFDVSRSISYQPR